MFKHLIDLRILIHSNSEFSFQSVVNACNCCVIVASGRRKQCPSIIFIVDLQTSEPVIFRDNALCGIHFLSLPEAVSISNARFKISLIRIPPL